MTLEPPRRYGGQRTCRAPRHRRWSQGVERRWPFYNHVRDTPPGDAREQFGMLPSSTRQIHVYGRKGRTRVVQDARPLDENGQDATPPHAAPPPPTKSLFTGLDLHTWSAWVQHPREAFTHQVATPIRRWATGEASALSSPTPSPRPPLQSRDNDEASGDLSQALADLTLTDMPDTLHQLLHRVHQDDPIGFTAQIDTLVGEHSVTKIGEASFSEVYQYTTPNDATYVIKVIPLEHGPSMRSGPALSPISSVDREVAVTAALGTLTEPWATHFVRLVSAHVVRGAYSSRLLQAWDAFAVAHPDRCENVRPSVLPATQMYALLVMEHAGTELERLPLRSWVERAAVFFQVACALAHAEQETQFEVRPFVLRSTATCT